MKLTVADVTITSELAKRPAHPPEIEVELAAMRRLADTLAEGPANVFQACVELGLELCGADTCGISLRERNEAGEDIFRWIALSGVLKEHLHGTTPRFFSPCGICVDSGAPLLMRRPELFYKYLDVGPPFHDVLLIPLTEGGNGLEGTIWIVAHDPDHKFDSEDARVMQRLAIFTATALHLSKMARDAKDRASAQELLFRELDHRIKNTLAMTAGLLRHQLGKIADPMARAAMESASGRMLSMGLMHQIGSGAASVDLAEIIRNICGDSLNPNPRFTFEVETETIMAPAHKAAVVALIVNELITNALKHAFRDRTDGKIAIRLHRNGENLAVLSIADDGLPLPEKPNGSDGLGLKLVARLADQLQGTLRTNAQPKEFTIVFPAHAH